VTPNGVGSVNSTGLYTAPSAISAQQTVTVTAANAADNAQFATAAVLLYPPVAVTIQPSTASLALPQTQLFTTGVSNAPSAGVSRSISPSGTGSIATSGLYTPPSSISGQQRVTLTATSWWDSTKSASATITLTDPPTAIAATSGSSQNTMVTTAFASALQATVTDYAGNPVSDASVTFTAPGSGASGTFAGSLTATVQTSSSGVATAPTLTANANAGNYTVTASVPGVTTSASFNLTNLPPPSIIPPNPLISGSGPFRNFSLTANDPNGARSIQVMDIGFMNVSGGAVKCIVEYVPSTAAFYLVGTGDQAGPLPAGSTGSIHNTTCVLTQPTASPSGSQATMNFLVTFNETAVDLVNYVLAFVQDVNGVNSGWQEIGTWTTSFVTQPPAVTSVSPSSGSGLSQTFTAIYNDPNGVGNISEAVLAIGPQLTGTSLCDMGPATGPSDPCR
jgi:hypothetical protein